VVPLVGGYQLLDGCTPTLYSIRYTKSKMNDIHTYKKKNRNTYETFRCPLFELPIDIRTGVIVGPITDPPPKTFIELELCFVGVTFTCGLTGSFCLCGVNGGKDEGGEPGYDDARPPVDGLGGDEMRLAFVAVCEGGDWGTS
jgi:hypothetical protein